MKVIPWSSPALTKADKDAVMRVLDSGWVTMGREVQRFEASVSKYLDVSYAVAVNSGTAALDVALKSLGVGKGDEVIIPAFTYVATGNAVLYNQATPVFVDIDKTLNIDASLIAERLTDRTKAMIIIDYGGNASDYNSLLRLSRKHGIPLIVDGAQSFGSEYQGKKCCTHGVVNTTSFHAAKILTTIEGGMVFTESKELAQRMRLLRNQGEDAKYIHPVLGHNYRMADVLAAVGRSQMRRFPIIVQRRRMKASYYKDHLVGVLFPKERTGTVNCSFLFVIFTQQRDQLQAYLQRRGIETRIHYPMPLNEQRMFRPFSKEVFPVARKAASQVLSLPIYHDLRRNQQDYIIKEINQFQRDHRGGSP